MIDEIREAELEGLLKEPIIDILHRKMAETDAKEIASRVFIQNSLNSQWTEVIIKFSGEDIRRMDRQEFRRHVSERLNAVGDALMFGWDKLRGEQK